MEMSLLEQLFEMRGSGGDVVPHPRKDGEKDGVFVVDVHRLGRDEKKEFFDGDVHEGRLLDDALEIPDEDRYQSLQSFIL